MTSGVVDWVQVGELVSLEWVHESPPVFIEDPPTPPAPLSLQSLTDVEGTTAVPAGRVLTKDSDGQWRGVVPASASASYRHDQSTPATVWTISHGLGRYPSSVSLHDAGLSLDYDEFAVQHLDVNTLRVSMEVPIAGAALIV